MAVGLISVLMAVHNNEEDVHRAVDSILKQTYTNFEFLIVDDASTDNTMNILKTSKIVESKYIQIRKIWG